MQRIQNFAQQTKKYITELNLFEERIIHTDPSALRTAILSTRVYIVLLTVFLLTLVIFNAIGTQPEVVLILNPSQSDYEDFIDKYRNLSSCPCSRITIPYANFTSTTVSFHPICQSIFVSDDWINQLFSPQFVNMYQLDFRVLANNYFRLLATFCSHVKQSVNDTLSNFHLQTFLGPNALVEKSLDAEINGISQYLQSSIMNSVRQLFLLVRSTTRSNELQTVVPLSTRMYMTTSKGIDILEVKPLTFRYTDTELCFCDLTERCSLPSGFFNSSQRSAPEIQSAIYIAPIVNVSGFFVGCLPVESLLTSTLECLFNSSCLNIIHRFIPASNMTEVQALNESQTRFSSKDPIEYLIDELFLEEWSIKANFSNYYVQCAPILCTHTLFKGKNPLYIITKLLSLCGGLTAVLRFFVPRVIGLLRKRRTIVAQGLRPATFFLHYLRTLWQSIRANIPELNLFKTRTMRTDPFEERTLKMSTWIYLVLLFLSTIIIVSFNWFNARIESKPITNLTLSKFEESEKKYSRALECPCSVIDIPHGSFISISPQFHPVCTSLLTNDIWISSMANTHRFLHNSIYKDIFEAGPKFFMSLQIFCRLIERIVSDALFNFNRSSLITNRALSNAELMARVKQILKQFEENTVAEAKRSLALIHSQTVTMYTTGMTDISWRRTSWRTGSYLTHFQPIPIEVGNCSCGIHENCKQQVVYYNYGAINNPAIHAPEVLYYIPNMYSSCFVTQSLLQSSLECFFEAKCMIRIVTMLNKDIKVDILSKTSTRFPPEMLLEEIIDKMMIETWNENINYSHYYEQCAPETCIYFVVSRNNAFYAFTVMIGLFGGLSTALRILVPRMVTWIRNRIYRRNNSNNRTGSSTFRERLRVVWFVIKKKLIELNLFESKQSWDNEHRRHREVLTTRLYLLFLVFSLLIIIVYTTVTVQTQSFKKTNPSRSSFEKLVNNPRYSSTLDCPCQNISIPYSSFISISPHYHQLCSSDFIVHNSMWINLIYTGSNLSNYSYDDYRHFVVPHFRLLYYLCTIANDTLTDALLRFRSTILISTRAQSRQTVIEQTNASINQFRSSVPKMFIRTLDFIQQMAQGNGLTSSIGSNWYPIPQKENGPVSLAPRTYGKNNCSCGIKSKCVSLARIDEWTVPGFLIGCYPLESLLQSTLECLYDITCINRLKNKNLSSNMNVCPLNRTLSPANVTVQSLIDGLMVEQWESDISYADYYASCAPRSCTYVIREQANSIYIITTIIGSFGGLTVALKIISVLVVKIERYVVMWHRRRVAPAVAVIS